jgi:hypothetical protein
MFKSTFFAAAIAIATIQPVFADDAMMKTDAMGMATCDDASMMKAQADVDATTDAAMKDMAMKEMDMAREAMKAGKADDCAMHLDGAMKAMTKG